MGLCSSANVSVNYPELPSSLCLSAFKLVCFKGLYNTTDLGRHKNTFLFCSVFYSAIVFRCVHVGVVLTTGSQVKL